MSRKLRPHWFKPYEGSLIKNAMLRQSLSPESQPVYSKSP